ncbi:MAG: hypothetical protein AB8B55_12010 [Mariniblastus sp.]
MRHLKFVLLFVLSAIVLVSCLGDGQAFSQDRRQDRKQTGSLDEAAVVGIYRRSPVENGWHDGKIEVVNAGGKRRLQWINKAGVKWDLVPDLANKILKTGPTNPYFENGQTEFEIDIRNEKVVGFWFQNSLFVKDGVKILPQLSQGFHGYISMKTQSPPKGFGYGASFYVSVWPLLEDPISQFQIGLPSTWITPDNRDFKKPLCPPGTMARDNWPERGPYYESVFQTIEGGLGYWVSTQFPTTSPKYRINGTPNGYNHEISSPGWGFGKPKSLSKEKMGIAQLSNRLLIPPDGITFEEGQTGNVLGNAWMVLPLATAKKGENISTGDNSWTLFLNSKNFKGPVAFWIPETWSRLSESYTDIDKRGLDSRPGSMGSGAMEVNTVPCFEQEDKDGVTYSKIPKIQFPVNKRGETFLMQDVTFYAKNTVSSKGRVDMRKAWQPNLTALPVRFDQGAEKANLLGIDRVVQTKIYGQPGKQVFGLKWPKSMAIKNGIGYMPQYFKQDGKNRIAITEDELPKDIDLAEQEFRSAKKQQNYQSPQSGVWTNPGPKTATSQVTLVDGSVVTYAWYRFVDQPSLVAVGWDEAEKKRMQASIEEIHRTWPIDQDYIPKPSRGKLAKLDGAVLVTPPAGFEIGYVPIVVSQTKEE